MCLKTLVMFNVLTTVRHHSESVSFNPSENQLNSDYLVNTVMGAIFLPYKWQGYPLHSYPGNCTYPQVTHVPPKAHGRMSCLDLGSCQIRWWQTRCHAMYKDQECQSLLCHPEANHLSLPDSSHTVRELCGQKYGIQRFYLPTYPTNQPIDRPTDRPNQTNQPTWEWEKWPYWDHTKKPHG